MPVRYTLRTPSIHEYSPLPAYALRILVLLVALTVFHARPLLAQHEGPATLLAQGDDALYRSDLDAAEKLYTSVVEQAEEPLTRARALARRCNLYLYRFYLDEAELDCRTAVDLAPELADGYIYLTRVYDWRRNYLFGLIVGHNAVALAPDDPVAYAHLAEVYGDMRLLAAAQAYMARAAALASRDNPAHAVVSRNQGHLFLAQNDDAGYEASLRRAVAWAPAFAPLREELGQFYVQTGNFDAQLDNLRHLLTIYEDVDSLEDQTRIQHLIAQSLYSAGRLDEALAEYEALLALERASGDAYGIVGTIITLSAMYQQIGDYERAVTLSVEALEIARDLGYPALIGTTATSLGRIYRAMGDLDLAVEHLELGVAMAEEASDAIGQIGALNELGDLHAAAGDMEMAVAYHQRALELSQSIGFAHGEGQSHTYLGLRYASLGNSDKAIEHFSRALEIARQLGNRFEEGLSSHNLGKVYLQIGAYAEAERYLNQALAVEQEIGDRATEPATVAAMGELHAARGQLDQGLAQLETALTLYRDLGDQSGEGAVLGSIGAVYLERGQYDLAQRHFEQAFEIALSSDDLRQQAILLNNTGTLASARGQYERSLQLFEQAETIARELGDRESIATSLANAGLTLWRTGLYQDALLAHQSALELVQEIGNRAAEATVLTNIGLVYQSLGLSNPAYEYYLRALEIQRTIDAAVGEANTLTALAHLHMITGDLENARRIFEEILEIQTTLGLLAQQATVSNNLGLIHAHFDDLTQAEALFRQALGIARELEDRRLEATILANLGDVAAGAGSYATALEYLETAAAIDQNIGDMDGLATTIMSMGQVYEATGNAQAALENYARAVEIHESLLNQINVEEFKICFTCLSKNVYARIVSLLVREDRPEEAYAFMERARERALLDQLANGSVDIRRGSDGALLGREAQLRAQIRALRAQLLELRSGPVRQWDLDSIRGAQQRLATLEASYASLLTELKLRSPETAGLISVQTTPLAAAQQMLDVDTTLLAYYMTDDEVMVSVITRTSFALEVLPVSPGDIALAIADFRAFVTLGQAHDPNLQALYSWLVEPVAERLKTSTLAIVPHGVLNYLPFAALTDGSSFLGERFNLYSLPSVSALPYVTNEEKADQASVLVVGDPEIDAPLAALPFAAQEAVAIAGLYHTQPLLRAFATETSVYSQAQQASVVHLAVHGEYNAGNPLFSALHLASDAANDGRLEVHEIYGLDLRAYTQLVVLSACETQRGVLSGGDEVLALNRAFLFAGTPSVIASLWNVDDAATAQLMQEFYVNLRQEKSKTAALAAAQAVVRRNYPHPFYWAAFVLTGDGG